MSRSSAVPCLLLLTLAAGSAAQEKPRTERVTGGAEYGAGGFHRAMLGASYRDLWTTPVEAEVLDLSREAGGVTPVRRVGGQQTKGLAFVGKDGRSYTFRGVEKDPSNLLPQELHDTFVQDLLRDQMAAQHPAGALIADELARAAGLPAIPVRFVVLPDDQALGEFRSEFKGLPGTFAEYPTAATAEHPGFEGALEILEHLALFDRLAESPDDRVAIREYLRLRLFDVFISDFDRHRKQWRWMRKAGDPRWHAIPEDRDQAFARYEGLLVRAVAGFVPQVRTFGKDYDKIQGLTYNGREQDRWLLPELPREAWHEEAKALQAAFPDEVLERAARRMPSEWYAIDGPRLVAALKQRREALVREADVFFDHLVEEVDVQATNASELARVTRHPDGAVDLELARLGASGTAEPPYFKRRFLDSETHDLRLYMRGGDDRVEVSGPSAGMTVRVVGGKGNDVVQEAESAGVRVYDSLGDNRVTSGTAWDRRPYTAPPSPPGAPWIPPRDWGRDNYLLPWFSFGSDLGVFIGGGVATMGYGFRKSPWADHQTLRAGWAFGAKQPRVDYRGEFRRVSSDLTLGLRAYWSGLEVLRYYGFGNETTSELDDDFYKVKQRQIVFVPSVTWPLVGALDLTVAPALQYSDTRDEDMLINEEQPYGTGSFGQVGGWVRLRLDTRRALARAKGAKAALPSVIGAAGYPVSGAYVETIATLFPKAWDVEETYGWVEGTAATYWTAGSQGRATLALRAGGKHVYGEKYPYFSAATVGGGGFFSGMDAVRGLHPNRFIGDTSAYGNAELRLYVSRFLVALPGEWGLFGFGDVGRVWLEGESSDKWHTSWGGGIWIGLLARTNAIALTVAQSDERTAFYLRAGFSF
ncbi:MAG TPA: hypothetical protein VIJ10_05550 [Vicinamibacteria bacterium]|jgi:hypothetical protein